jgi:hypothetical protein
MAPVEIDIDAQGPPTAPFTPATTAARGSDGDETTPIINTRAMAARAMMVEQQTHPAPVVVKRGPPSTASSGSLSKHTRSSASLSGQDPDDFDESPYDENGAPHYLHRGTAGNSFNVDQMLASSGRDSLLMNNGSLGNVNNAGGVGASRQSEYGSALMRMDDGYRSSSINVRRTAAAATVDGLTPLLQAARSGDLVLLNSLIIQPGTDILRRDPVYGQTALHFAIRGGHLAIVQALLMPELAGSIVNVPDSRRNTALHLAAAKSRRMAKILIDARADVNFVNMRNQTPLGVHILTVTKDDPTMTEILLQARANPNAPVDKSTALHVALDKGLYQIAQRLVRHGGRLDMKDESGKMVFDKVDATLLKVLMSNVTHAPVWIPDDECSKCMECKKQFGSLGTRRHHCRFCGRLLCSKCTGCQLRGSDIPFRQRRKKDRQSPTKNQRVCTMCYEITMESKAAATSAASTSNASTSVAAAPAH